MLQESNTGDAQPGSNPDALEICSVPTAPNVIEPSINSQQYSQQKTDLISELPIVLSNLASSENNCLIEFLEKLSECSITIPAKFDAKLPLSPKNCFGIAVLAKQSGDADLQRHVSDYFIEKLDTILSSESLKLLKLQNFKNYLDASDLKNFLKIQIVDARLSGLAENEADIEIMKIAVALSAEYRTKYLALTARCHSFLKHQLSGWNCLETAIFAERYKMDELKIWAEYHVITNFNSILSNILTGVYSVREVAQFCKMCSIPTELCDMMLDIRVLSTLMKEQLEPDTDDADKWVLTQLRKLSSIMTETIGPKGGVIELDGCCINFPEGALTEDTEIILMVNTDPANYPHTGIPITPILHVEPSLTLEKPATVILESCSRDSDEQMAAVQFFTDEGDGWKLNGDIELERMHDISFTTNNFSKFAVVQAESNGQTSLKNEIFIQAGTGLIRSRFYNFSKDGSDIGKVMREMGSASFSTLPMRVEGIKDDVVQLEVELRKPEKVTLPRDDWLPRLTSMTKAAEYGFCNIPVIVAVPSLESVTCFLGKYKA